MPGDGNRWPAGVTVIGPSDRIYIDPSAEVEPHVLLDTRAGPIVVAAAVQLSAFCRLEGPCVIGAGSSLNRATIRGGTTLGPGCRLGGLVESSVVQGYLERPHDGVLTSSAIGEWVTIGPFGSANGACIGDLARLGAGTILPDAAMVGAFASVNVAGHSLPRVVPAFETLEASGTRETALWSEIFSAASNTFTRHGVKLSEPLANLYRAIVTGKEPRPTARPRDNDQWLRRAG